MHKNIYIYKSNSKFSLLCLFEINDLIKKKEIEIIHCHLFRAFFSGIIIKLLFANRIKLVFHEHSRIYESDNKNKIEDFLYFLFLKIFKNKVDLFIAVTKAIKEELIKKISIKPGKIVSLYNYVDLNKFDKIKFGKNHKNIKKDKKYFNIGFAGRIVERKGWREFIEAAKIICNKIKNINFFIAGDGPQKYKMLKFIEKNKLNNKIFYLGYKSEIRDFYYMLDCFVLSSHWEGLPMTQLEVMAFGIPLVTSNGPGMNEIPVDNVDALFCRVKDPADLAEKILILYNNKKLREKLIKNGKIKIKKHSIQLYIKNLNGIYKTI